MIVRRIRGILWLVLMPSQVVYETNADLIASHEVMVKYEQFVVADMNAKGVLWFKFKGNPTVFLLSPFGKLQVKWSDVHEKKTLFRLLRNILIARPGDKLLIKPLRQQTWIEYPVPESFKLYWCDTSTEYALKSTATDAESEDGAKTEDPTLICRLTAKAVSRERRQPKVIKALEELRHEFRLFREPTFNEIALKSGCLDKNALRKALMLAGWKAESPEEAMSTAEQAINLAAWLRFKQSGELNPQFIALANEALGKASMNAIRKAQDILKNYPELLPVIEKTVLLWPQQTKAKWVEAFGYPAPAPQHWTLWSTSLLSRSD